MATINSEQSNCVLFNILTNAAKLPGYSSPLSTIMSWAQKLPKATLDSYYTKSSAVIASGKYSEDQFAALFKQHIVQIVNQSTNETEFATRLLAFIDSL
jgi:hypothetical protein